MTIPSRMAGRDGHCGWRLASNSRKPGTAAPMETGRRRGPVGVGSVARADSTAVKVGKVSGVASACPHSEGAAYTPPTTLHTRTAYTPIRRHDSASSATYPPTRPRQSRLMLSAISPAPRRQSGSAHRTAPGRYAYLRSLSRPLPLRSCSSCHRSRTASCPGRSSPSASST